MPVDEVEDRPLWKLVPAGNIAELFEGEEVLVESSDAEEDAAIAKEPQYVYESWLDETARKQVFSC